jgi:hypothetical protein
MHTHIHIHLVHFAQHCTKQPGTLLDLGGAKSVVDALFGIEMEEELKCSETDEEPAKVTTERQFRLVCNIQGGAGSAVQIAHLHEGIKMGLTGQVSCCNH